MTNQDFQEVIDLLRRSRTPPEFAGIAGASDAARRAFFQELGLGENRELDTWLSICSGAPAGPGGLFGCGDAPGYLSISARLQEHPFWQRAGWVPVAGDGNGGYYVALMSEANGGPVAVGYIDPEDYENLAFVVASSLERFLVGLLRRDLREAKWWPFDEQEVLAFDPDLSKSEHPKPWEA